jgi:2-keto-4-pentenoate hydratase/2-oxohepta-3-ene-1,7-dioic acid hydratase in catechol pathway
VRRSTAGLIATIVISATAAFSAASADIDLDGCMNNQDIPRIARILDPNGDVVYALVTAQDQGFIIRARTIAPDGTPLVDVFQSARLAQTSADYEVNNDRVCSVVSLPEASIDAETHVIVSVGLNYTAHAEEAGGGDVFLFPKPSQPTRAYASVHPGAGVTLFDYEVELAYVLLEEVDPLASPSTEALMAKVAFFLTNDVSDREPIIGGASLSGPGTGFAEGKGQPGFFPAGPWMVLGTDLYQALEACSGKGLGLRLFVDDEAEPRQDASTEFMILQPTQLIGRIGSWIEEHGRRSVMTFVRPDEDQVRFYPLAVGEDSPKLTAGSIVQTGTPEGVALNAPSPLGVTLRGALHLRSPFAQFLVEEKERVAAGGTRYLAPGNTVRASIDGLGTQQFTIGEAGGRPAPHGCDETY